MEKASVILTLISTGIQLLQKLDELTSDSYDKYLKYDEKIEEINKLKDAVLDYEIAVLKAQQAEKGWFGEDSLQSLKDYKAQQEQIMQFGDCSGLVIDGVDLSGYSAYLNNIYITGVIKWLEDNIDKLKGKDAYIVELSSYYAIVNVNSQGQIDDSIYDLVNIVSGENYTYTGTSQIVQKKYKIQTMVQVATQSSTLEYIESNPGERQYSLSVVATGCT